MSKGKQENTYFKFAIVLRQISEAQWSTPMLGVKACLPEALNALGEPNEWVFQYEIGDKEEGANGEGQRHVQIYFRLLRNRKRCKPVAEKLVAALGLLPAQVGVQAAHDEDGAARYCSKSATRVPGTEPEWSSVKFRNQNVKIVVDNTELKKLIEENGLPYQKLVARNMAKPTNDRAVVWFWSSEGRTGKSTLVKYLQRVHGATFITQGKSGDLLHALMARLKDPNADPVQAAACIVVDIARADDKKEDEVEMCKALECYGDDGYG
jgi:hypothetical protein